MSAIGVLADQFEEEGNVTTAAALRALDRNEPRALVLLAASIESEPVMKHALSTLSEASARVQAVDRERGFVLHGELGGVNTRTDMVTTTIRLFPVTRVLLDVLEEQQRPPVDPPV